jgi:hypothetical protein
LVAPDRRGHNSRDKAQDLSVAALLDASAHRLKAERALEHGAGLGLRERLAAQLAALGERVWPGAARARRCAPSRMSRGCPAAFRSAPRARR